jgi:glycosyltransferase involved in cell wall biosynthesis
MRSDGDHMKTALVHDWLTGMRGGEKCLEALCGIFPEADVFALVHVPGSVSGKIERHAIRTSFVQNLPFVKGKYRSYLPLFPAAIERFDLRAYDLVVSSSHCAAKGIIPRPDAFHLCYCHTPMRYVWDMYHEYFGGGRTGPVSGILIPFFANYLRMWDVASSVRVDRFVANSEHVRKRILKYYGRPADVVHPPVETARTRLSRTDDGYFLIVSAFAPYKRVDLAVEAFNRLGERLVVVGSGPEEKRLKAAAKPNITFAGWAGAEALRGYYANCRALVFPGEEDFGIVPVEAQCWGKPVIAFGRGGALETVRGHWADSNSKPARNCTGVFFREQTADGLAGAMKRFSRTDLDAAAIRKHALSFDASVFERKIGMILRNRERR